MCRICLDYAYTLRKNKVAGGKCQWCGRPLASKTLCQKCLDKQTSAREAKMSIGECTFCDQKAVSGGSTCLVCRSRRRLWKHGISREDYKFILKTQDNKCPLCGRILDANCNIDHDHRCCRGVSGGERGRKPACGKCIRGIVCWKCNRFLVAWGDFMLQQPNGEELLRDSYPALLHYLNSKLFKK